MTGNEDIFLCGLTVGQFETKTLNWTAVHPKAVNGFVLCVIWTHHVDGFIHFLKNEHKCKQVTFK